MAKIKQLFRIGVIGAPIFPAALLFGAGQTLWGIFFLGVSALLLFWLKPKNKSSESLEDVTPRQPW